jgi:L-aminopeptidase/D-esterase-like protein
MTGSRDTTDPARYGPAGRPRARGLGLPVPGMTGVLNAITDVPGLSVGFTTLKDPALGIMTGVTAILPRAPEHLMNPIWAGARVPP